MSVLDRLAEPVNHLVIATNMLQELICHLGSGDGELDNEEFDRTFYVGFKVMQDAKALQDLIEKLAHE